MDMPLSRRHLHHFGQCSFGCSHMGGKFLLQSGYAIDDIGAVSFVFSSPSVTSQNATIVYSSALTSPSLKTPTLAITDLDYFFQGGKMSLMLIVVSNSQSGLQFGVQIAVSSTLHLLKLTYMALDSSFQPAFSMNYFFPQILQNGTIAVLYQVNFTQSTGVTLNTSH